VTELHSNQIFKILFFGFIFCAGNLMANEPIQIAGYEITNEGRIRINHPAFVSISKLGSAQPRLIVSSFGLFGKDSVKFVQNPADLLVGLGQPNIELVTDEVTWPNEISEVGAEVFGRAGWLVSGGFLVPGKSTGAVNFIDGQTNRVVPIVQSKPNYFYHRTQIVHWGPGGSLAVLTARAKKPIFGATESELVLLTPRGNFLEAMDSGDGSLAFEETILVSGPDVFFQAKDLDGDGIEELVAAEFFGKKLVLFWWDSGRLQKRLIDDQIGSVFDLVFGDLQGDGSLALVVTNHEGGHQGAVYAYEVPHDFKQGEWKKHPLLGQIVTHQPGFNSAAPGSPIVFYPSSAPQGKPWIFVSGDGSQRGHLLTPHSSNPTDWNYIETIILTSRSTIGKAAVGDVDGTGFKTIFIPEYDGNQIDVFKITPAAAN
jgi:hypothetical protein